jgi:hypothetical protein
MLLRSIKAFEKIRIANDDQKTGVDIVARRYRGRRAKSPSARARTARSWSARSSTGTTSASAPSPASLRYLAMTFSYALGRRSLHRRPHAQASRAPYSWSGRLQGGGSGDIDDRSKVPPDSYVKPRWVGVDSSGNCWSCSSTSFSALGSANGKPSNAISLTGPNFGPSVLKDGLVLSG